MQLSPGLDVAPLGVVGWDTRRAWLYRGIDLLKRNATIADRAWLTSQRLCQFTAQITPNITERTTIKPGKPRLEIGWLPSTRPPENLGFGPSHTYFSKATINILPMQTSDRRDFARYGDRE